MLSIRESVHLTSIDPEENHEREEVDIEALIRKIEGQAQEERCERAASLQSQRPRSGAGSSSAPELGEKGTSTHNMFSALSEEERKEGPPPLTDSESEEDINLAAGPEELERNPFSKKCVCAA